RREGFARNERDSLSRRFPAEDSVFHGQIGKSRGRGTPLADCGRTRGFSSWVGCGKMVRQNTASEVAHREARRETGRQSFFVGRVRAGISSRSDRAHGDRWKGKSSI